MRIEDSRCPSCDAPYKGDKPYVTHHVVILRENRLQFDCWKCWCRWEAGVVSLFDQPINVEAGTKAKGA